MNDEQMTAAFNEWMRLYIEDPASFEAEFQSVRTFQQEQQRGDEPTYGANCAAMMHRMLARVS